MWLAPSQIAALNRLDHLLSRSGTAGLRCVISGPRGSGRKTVARFFARRSGFRVFEASLEGSTATVERTIGALVQSAGEDVRERGLDAFCLLLLSGLDGLQPEAQASVHALLRNGTAIVGDSVRAFLPEQAWILATFDTVAARPSVGGDHWILSAFDHRISIALPKETEVVSRIAAEMLRGLGGPPTIAEEALTLLSRLSSDGLHGLRTRVEFLAARCAGASIAARADAEAALAEDLQYWAERIEYRGRRMEAGSVMKWASQFPDHLIPLAIALVRLVSDQYYVGGGRYYELIDKMLLASGLDQRGNVVICQWQPEGKSAPELSHRLHSRGRWPNKFCRLDDPDTWTALDSEGTHEFVIVDDFVGTGGTLEKLRPKKGRGLQDLLDAFPNSHASIFVMVALEKGLERATAHLDLSRERTALYVGVVLTSADTCFSEDSSVIESAVERQAFKDFCLGDGRTRMGLSKTMCLGAGADGVLTVFQDSVPNNTIAVLWSDKGKDWRPLFPR